MADGFEIKFNTQFDKARESAERRGVVLPSVYYGQLPKQMRSLANTISYIQSVEQIQTILNDLKRAIDSGNSFEKWRKDFNPEKFGITKAHAETVYRNALQTQYSVGRWEQAQMAKKTHPYLRYVTINDSRTSQCCRALSGIIRPIDSPFWATHTPPNHHRCRSIVVSLTEKEAQKRSPAMVGLNQPESPDMQPQKGWDYNPALSHQAQMTDLAKAKIEKLPPVIKSKAEKILADLPKIMTDWKELNLPSAKELLKTLELMQAPEVINIANNEQEALAILRAELGVKAGEKMTITTPVGNVLIDDAWLPHIVEKRDAARERFSKWIIPTLESPTEVWLSDYGNEEFRKRYLKLFSASDKQLLVVISILNDSAIWNVVPMPVRSMDNQRSGELLLKNY